MNNRIAPAAISHLHKQKEEWMTQIKGRENELAEQLHQIIPSNLTNWYEESGEGMIKGVIEYGVSSRKYRRNDIDRFDFEIFEEFAVRLWSLQEIWAGVVEIEIDWDSDYRFEITFTAV